VLANIGVLRVLEREKIPIDFLAGASMGGLIAASYAAGLNSYDIEQIAQNITQRRHLLRMVDPGLPNGGLIRGRQVYAFFKQIFGETTFADLRLPLAVVAVDLLSHQEVVLQSGPVALAIRATTSIPGLFMPVEMNGMRLTDGGVLNNLPVDTARKMGAERVIAVDIGLSEQYGIGHWLGNHRWMPDGLSNTFEVIDDTLYALRIAEQEYRLSHYPPDILISPGLPDNVNTIVGYHRLPELIAAGERAAEAHLSEMIALACSPAHEPLRGKAGEKQYTISPQPAPKTNYGQNRI
jgi:NTE family protein